MDTAHEMFAQLFRHYREDVGSVTEAARVARYRHSYVSQIEHGKRIPALDTARAFDKAWGAGGAIYDAAHLLHKAGRKAATVEDAGVDCADSLDDAEAGDVERRELLQRALGMIGAAGAAGSLAYVDAVRATLDDALDRSVEEWQEVAWDYGRDVLTMAPADLLDDLGRDVLAVRRLLARNLPYGQRSSLQHVAAQLSAMMALTLGNLGEISRARGWWRTAVTAADRSGDPELMVQIRGKRAIDDLYFGVPASDIAAATDRALTLPGGGAGRMSALGARAQALALAGDSRASAAVDELADAYAALPATAGLGRSSFWGWPEQRLHFTRSYVYIRTADARAGSAQDAALSLYPSTEYENPTLIELHRATWLARNGDPSEGLRYAMGVITPLPQRYRSNTVMVAAHDVARALPAGAETAPEAVEYRELLAASVSS